MNINTSLLNVIVRIRKDYTSSLASIGREEGLSLGEATVISFLHCNPGQDSPCDIVRLLRLAKGNVSSSIASLEKNKRLIVSKDKTDHRLTHLTLTDADSAFCLKIDQMRDLIFSKYLKGFSEEEIKQFSDFVTRIAENAERR
jgi:DNA-binding MarR family transcriptional regulator